MSVGLLKATALGKSTSSVGDRHKHELAIKILLQSYASSGIDSSISREV